MISNMLLAAGTGGDKTTTWIMVALLVVLVVVLLIVPIFTNKKRSKQTVEMHNSLQPGDKIKTVGGVIGVIKEIKKISPNDTEMVIETGEGDNKTTMTFDIQALYQVLERAMRVDSAANNDVFAEHEENKIDEPAKEMVEEPVKEAETTEVVAEEAKPEEETVAAEAPVEPEKTEETVTATETPAEEPAKPAVKKATPAKKKPVASAKNSTKK